MSRLLWFVLGGVATAVGAGVAAVMMDGESDGDSSHEDEDGQEAIESQDDTASPEQPA
ncbi:hypothetical protein WCP94_002959 [Bilophila wadsworthia]|uniref:hypothetical protein n=1 Tax=Bilophila wadsworthia TaxID=35833 RepID=UPI003D6EFF40